MGIEWTDSESTAVLPLSGAVLKFVEGRVRRVPSRAEVMLVKWPIDTKVDGTQPDEKAWTQVVTVETRDRDGDVLRIAGADLSAWRAAMRIFHGHGWRTGERPIARGLWVRPLKSPRPHLLSKAQIWDGGGNPEQDWATFCLETYAMIAGKYIEDSSIGFIPLKARPLERSKDAPSAKDGDVDLDRYRADIITWILLEWSMVGIPSNPDAHGAELTKSLVEHYAKAADELRLSKATLVTVGKTLKLDLVGAIAKQAAPANDPVAAPDAVDAKTPTWTYCVCEACGHWEDHKAGDPCQEHKCPECGAALKGSNEKPAAKEAKAPADALGEMANAVATLSNVEAGAPGRDPLRWNPTLSKAFDVAGMELPPSSVYIEIVAKFLECGVKEISQRGFTTPGAEMGGYLSAFTLLTNPFDLVDLRNVNGNGSECPPIHETIQLNSKQSDEFLIDGTEFFKTPEGPMVVNRYPVWGGERLVFYTKRQNAEFVDELLTKAVEWVRDNNFLKGEKFALSGRFLEPTADTFDGLFLDVANKTALERAVSTLNKKGAAMTKRGMILMGPPGTGKTLAGRVMMNAVKDATFIWVSARDFYYSSVMGSIEYGFDLARKLAPAVLFIEDIDNWLRPQSVDMLKTELDGLAQSRGVLTVLTTNFPEQLPEALIDRPGRFHDVLDFALPDTGTRAAMLQAWLPEAPEAAVAKAIEETDGYSGAHLYELAEFAKSLHEDDPDLDMGGAVELAIAKVKEQRALIDAVQRQGSNYRPSKAVLDVFTKAYPDLADAILAKDADGIAGDEEPPPVPTAAGPEDIDGGDEKDIAAAIVALKGGRVLSRKTRQRLEDCHQQLLEGARAGSTAADLLRELLDTADIPEDKPADKPEDEAAETDKSAAAGPEPEPIGTADVEDVTVKPTPPAARPPVIVKLDGAVFAGAIGPALAAAQKDGMREAIDRLRGRIPDKPRGR